MNAEPVPFASSASVDRLRLLSVIIPARDEEESIAPTLDNLLHELQANGIPHEIVVIDDGSRDGTWRVLQEFAAEEPAVCVRRSEAGPGFGCAVARGVESSRGDAVVIMMADGSDDYGDVPNYWRLLQKWDCVFGSRFIPGGAVIDYPTLKLVLNRLANFFIQIAFGIRLNDTTNAFKGYRRTVLEACRPFWSSRFNLTVELPLKAIVRGYSWTVIPTVWRNRERGRPKFKIKEMGSRYLLVIARIWMEKVFSPAPGGAKKSKSSRGH